MQTSTTPLPGYVRIFQQYLQHTCMSIHVQRYVREALAGVGAGITGFDQNDGKLHNDTLTENQYKCLRLINFTFR